MPLVRVALAKGKPAPEGVHQGLVEELGVAPADRFQLIEQLDHDALIYSEGLSGHPSQ